MIENFNIVLTIIHYCYYYVTKLNQHQFINSHNMLIILRKKLLVEFCETEQTTSISLSLNI